MKKNSQRLTSIIIAALFVAVAFIIYFEFIVPAYSGLETTKGQEESEAALYSNESQVVTQVKSLITSYQGEASSTQSVDLALPVGQNLAGALAQVYGIAGNTGFLIQNTGISVQNVQVQATAAPSNSISGVASGGGSIVRPVGTITFQVTGTGSYETFKSFLEGLENNIRLFDVTGVSISPASGQAVKGVPVNQDMFNYTLTVATYYQSS